MSSSWVELCHVRTPPAFRFDGEHPELEPLPLSAIRAELREAQLGTGVVTLGGPEPTAHPQLREVVRYAKELGQKVRLQTHGRRLNLQEIQKLRDDGVFEIVFQMMGARPQSHDPTIGQPGAFTKTTALAAKAAEENGLRVAVDVVLTKRNHAEMGKLAQAFPFATRVCLVRLSTLTRSEEHLKAQGVPRRLAVAAIEDAWRALQGICPLRTVGFGSYPGVRKVDGEPIPLDGSLLELLQEHVPINIHRRGTVATPAGLEDLARVSTTPEEGLLELAALGAPAVNVGPRLGGSAAETAPELGLTEPPAIPAAGSTIHVVNPFGTDLILASATMPGLVRELRALGHHVVFHDAWRAENGSVGPTEQARAFNLSEIDLSGADTVVVPGFKPGADVFANPSFPAHARMILADFHLKDGINHWHRLHGREWPDRVAVHSIFPSQVRTVRRLGVPPSAIRWMHYPMDPVHYGRRDDLAGWVFAGGNHQRDYATLAAALFQLPFGVHRVRVNTELSVHNDLDNGGVLSLPTFYETVARSRVVVLPLLPTWTHPAGLSVLAMARAAGRPVVATATPSTAAAIRHGVDGVLVPPRNPKKLSAAIAKVDFDESLQDRLATASYERGQRHNVAAWAARIHTGDAA